MMTQWARSSLSGRLIAIGLLLLVVTTHAAWSVGLALAHGEGESLELFSGREGSYQVVVEVQPVKPVVGWVHFSVIPLEADSLLPVHDALITIVALNERDEPTFQAPALITPGSAADSPPYYDANITFDEAGAWSLRVSLESERLGAATVNVPLEIGVQPVLPGGEGTIVFLLVIAAIVGGTAYVWLSARRVRKAAGA